MSEGYLGLFRLFFNSPEWNEKRVFSRAEAWLDLLQFAAYVPTERYINGKSIHHEIGEFVAAERFLENRWGWSRTKVRNFIQIHEKNHRLDHRKDQGETVRRVCKYETYVFCKTKEDTKGNTTEDTKEEPPKNQRRTKVKKGNKDKPEKNILKAQASAIEEVIEYCQSLDLETSDGIYLWNHWESNGWTNGGRPIKDWKATVRAWKAAKHLPSQKNGGQKGSSYGQEAEF